MPHKIHQYWQNTLRYTRCHIKQRNEINSDIIYMSHNLKSIQGKRYKEKQGWIKLYIYGSPYIRGFAHGYLLHKELDLVMEIFPTLVRTDLDVSYEKYIKDCTQIITPRLCESCAEIYHELQGIVAGYNTKGGKMSIEELIAWNSMMSMYTYYKPDSCADRCSAFIACGNATEKGDIVMAHNSHSDYVFAQVVNVIIHIKPEKGYAFTMQCCPGYVASGLDWFVTEKGLIGCETTIGNFSKQPDFTKNTPYFCRIREVMQYGKNLDECANMMIKDNAGDYPCSWLFGDVNNNEIMLCELGLKHTHVEKKKDGIFYGMNSAINEDIRKKETTDKTHWRTSSTSGARNVRLHVLLYETYQNKINIQNAKKIISDHHDVFLDRSTEGNSRTLCKHSENDTIKTNQKMPRPFGAIDGKVINTQMAKQMSFYGIYGNSCGKAFNPKTFTLRIKKQSRSNKKKISRSTKKLLPQLKHIRSHKWTNIKVKN